LFFEGTELEDDRPLSSYNVQTGSIIDLRVNHSSPIQLNVETFAGKKTSLNVHSSDTIKILKDKIKEKLDNSPDITRLLDAGSGKQFDGNQPYLTLADYGVKNGGRLFIGTPNSLSIIK
jgi:hypothetical protein